jgi:hypothetical protein
MSALRSGKTISDASPFRAGDLSRHTVIGRDQEGYRHHLDRESGKVHRMTISGTRERVVDLTTRDAPAAVSLELYVDFVGQAVGWDSRQQLVGTDVWGPRDQ